MSMTKPTATLLTMDDAMLDGLAAGRIKIRYGNTPIRCRLTPTSRREYERAKRVGYISTKARDEAQNLYWEFCEVYHCPMVTIRPKVKYASISCDMIVAGYRLDAEAMNRINPLRGRPMSYGMESGTQVCFALLERIPIDQAETIAFRVYEIAMACAPPEIVR